MKNINYLIENYVNFLRNNWEMVKKNIELDTSGSFKNDWLQANWELIVEGFLNNNERIFLQVYGDGADANGDSSRILYPKSLPTHCIGCFSKSISELWDVLNEEKFIIPHEGVNFDKFVCIRDGWYYEDIPFDAVLINVGDKERIVSIDYINFFLKEVVVD